MFKGLAKHMMRESRGKGTRMRVLLSDQTRTHYKTTRLNVTFIIKSLKG